MDCFEGFARSGLIRIAREDGVFEIWRLDLDASEPDPDVLSEAEHHRARRFVHLRDRNQFMATRAALRRLLGAAIGVAPEEIRFATGRHGKPCLAERHGPPFQTPPFQTPQFNVSHAGAHALIGLAQGRAIGVDIEVVRENMDELQLAQTVFCEAERRRLEGLDKTELAREFYRIWTCKEAVLKAFGVGIGEHLQDFAVEPGAAGFVFHPRPGFAALDFIAVRAEPLPAPKTCFAAFALAPIKD